MELVELALVEVEVGHQMAEKAPFYVVNVMWNFVQHANRLFCVVFLLRMAILRLVEHLMEEEVPEMVVVVPELEEAVPELVVVVLEMGTEDLMEEQVVEEEPMKVSTYLMLNGFVNVRCCLFHQPQICRLFSSEFLPRTVVHRQVLEEPLVPTKMNGHYWI